VTPLDLATWILADALPRVRMQIQMHKIIWEPNRRGV
jgi:7-carboxy-7-deazaguanine synthase